MKGNLKIQISIKFLYPSASLIYFYSNSEGAAERNELFVKSSSPYFAPFLALSLFAFFYC